MTPESLGFLRGNLAQTAGRETVARFIAIPVGQGDAFFLETPDGSVLVDGGRSVLNFASQFCKETGQSGVDILICTHNDADHANGVLGFLQSGLECREVWLPGRWLAVLPHVLNPSTTLAGELLIQAREAIQELRRCEYNRQSQSTLLEQYGDVLAERGYEGGAEPEPIDISPDDGWPETLIDSLENTFGTEDIHYPQPWGVCWYPWRWWRNVFGLWFALDTDERRMFLDAIDATERIRRIAAAAYHRGVTVRWFQYDPSGVDQEHTWLVPLNSRPVTRVYPSTISEFLRLLALTTSNRQSLVFWSTPQDNIPGVLFTADSDLRGIQVPNDLKGAIVTAPHHGAETNSGAYQIICKMAGGVANTIIWVRSDGRYRNRPGNAFLSMKKRVCTICRPPCKEKAKQRVLLVSRSRTWVRSGKTRWCCCTPPRVSNQAQNV